MPYKDTEVYHQKRKGWDRKYYESHRLRFQERNKSAKIRNQFAVDEYLKDKACVDCGTTNRVVLTFDHTRDKKYTISQMVNYSYGLELIFEEIAKCEIRCFNCHMIKEAKKRGNFKWTAV